MALSYVNYLKNLELALETSLCIRKFGSEVAERQEKPEVEMKEHYAATKNKPGEFCNLNPIYVTRSEDEYCMIEPSINSARVLFLLLGFFCLREETTT